MSDQEFVLAIIAITMGCAVLIVGITKIAGLIKSWIGGSSEVDEESFNRLARAFMEHKKETRQRIQNLESIIADDDSTKSSKHENSSKQIEAPKKSIEFDDSENVSKKSESNDNNKNNLRNMLRE